MSSAAPERYQYTEVHMGVQTRVVLWAEGPAVAESAARAAFNRIEQLDSAMSDYRVDSELNRLSAKAGGPAMKISRDLFAVLALSCDLARRSSGAFDPTVGPLVRLWRTARRSGRLPEAAALKAARAASGWRMMILDAHARTARLARPGMKLDLGGIAKGYACQKAVQAVAQQGVRSCLVEMGGDVALGAAPPGERGWRVEIPNAPEPQRMQVLSNCAVSTSGDTEQYVEIGGKRYSHIVDPRTGTGLTSRIAVTVIAPDGGLSDSLSTAVSVLGEAQGRKLCTQFKGVRLFLTRARDAESGR